MQTVAINQVYPVEYGWYMTYFPVHCCNTFFNTNAPDTYCEGPRPQIPRRALAEVASLQPLLIRNCGGGYDPYFDPPAREFDLQKAFNSHSKIALN